MSTQPDERRVGANGLHFVVRECGTGEPLVLVHGSLDDHQTWRPLEEELTHHFRVISFARRGHAGSEDGSAGGLRRDDEDDLAGLLAALELAPAAVVANSFGASIALGLAARRPELISSLCIHEPPLLDVAADDPAVTSVRPALAAIRGRIETGDAEAAVRDFVDDIVLGPGAWELLGPDEHAAMVAAAGTFAEELRDPDWASLDTNALVAPGFRLLLTTGQESPAFLTSITQRLADVVDAAVLHRIPGAGHIPHLTHTSAYASAIRDFVRRVGNFSGPDASPPVRD